MSPPVLLPKVRQLIDHAASHDSPTFLDIHLTRLTNGKHSEPEHFKDIFERGIDPHVDDPNQCHVSCSLMLNHFF